MKIGITPFEYEWISDRADVADRASAATGRAHHGVAMTEAVFQACLTDCQQPREPGDLCEARIAPIRCIHTEKLNRAIFESLRDVQVLTERWRTEYNTTRPYSSPGYRRPVAGGLAGSVTGHSIKPARNFVSLTSGTQTGRL